MADIIDFVADPAEATRDTVRNAATGCFHQMRAAFQNADSFIWVNPYGLTPQQAFNALGNRSASLVDFLTRIAVAINQTGPDSMDVVSSKPAGVVLTKNPDGTVTLS